MTQGAKEVASSGAKALLGFDPSLDFQVLRDLLDAREKDTEAARKLIGIKGWAADLLDMRKPDGHWGNGAYNPKWTCTHYVLYELHQLGMPEDSKACRDSCDVLLSMPEGEDGGVNFAKTVGFSDVCVNGMLLAYSSRFGAGSLDRIVEYLLGVRMADGGWNCVYMDGARHSSLHTTISVLEGLWNYLRSGGKRRADEIREAIAGGVEFILRHRLYKSERTGEVIKDDFFKFAFPVRWKYDILRCLDLFREFGVPYDPRMDGALDAVVAARRKDGMWSAASQPGKVYFVKEKNGAPGRWNTLRALRLMKAFQRII
jgi:hypothetical protein